MTKEEVEKARNIMERFDPELISLVLQDFDLSASAIEKAKKGIAAIYDAIPAESPQDKARIMAKAISEAQLEMIKEETERIKKALGKIDKTIIAEALAELQMNLSHYTIPLSPPMVCLPGSICYMPGPGGCVPGRICYLPVPGGCSLGPICYLPGPGGCRIGGICYFPGPRICFGCVALIGPPICPPFIPPCGFCQQVMNVLDRHPKGSVIVDGKIPRDAVVDVQHDIPTYICEEMVDCQGANVTIMKRCAGKVVSLEPGEIADVAGALKKIAEANPVMAKRLNKMLSEMKNAGEL